MQNVTSVSQLSTPELKERLLQRVQGRDTDSLSEKVAFFKKELQPLFEELQSRNPFPAAETQASLVVGVWLPVWSTIPFQDILPGRSREQSYQIFHDDGYYANMARYVPGQKLGFVKKLASMLLAYDLMIVQKFQVNQNQWFIENVAIEQAFRVRATPLDIDRAERWFSEVVEAKLRHADPNSSPQKLHLQDPGKKTAKKLEKTFHSTPQLEHLYIDPDFRLVKSQREAKQRPSYTIAVRLR